MPATLGAAVIGTGFGATVHAPAFIAHPAFDLVAVCSAQLERAKDAARRLGVQQAFSDYRQVLAMDTVQVVSIAAPPYLHYEMTMEAIRAGKHVICEKPMALTAAEASTMTDAAIEAGVANAIVFEFRYQPERVHVHQLIADGYLGKIENVHIKGFGSFAWQEPSRLQWIGDPALGGGYLGAIGSHSIDAVRHWCGEFAGVYGRTDHHRRLVSNPANGAELSVGSEDGFSAIFRLAGGVGGVLDFNQAVSAPELPGPGTVHELYGDEGTLILTQGRPLQGARRGESVVPMAIPPGPAREEEKELIPSARAFCRLLDDFSLAISDSAPVNMPAFVDGLRCQEFMDGLRSSEREGRWVSLESVHA